MNARRASLASSEPLRMPPAFDVITMVVSMLVSSEARMMRLEIHCTIGGIAIIRPPRSRVNASSSYEATRWLKIGRASCRERVCQYVVIWVVGVPLKKEEKYV